MADLRGWGGIQGPSGLVRAGYPTPAEAVGKVSFAGADRRGQTVLWPLPHLAQALQKQGGCRGRWMQWWGGVVPVHLGAPESTGGPSELGALPQPLGSNDLRVFPLTQQPVSPHLSLALEAEVSKLDPAHPWSCFLGVIPSIEGNKESQPNPPPHHIPLWLEGLVPHQHHCALTFISTSPRSSSSKQPNSSRTSLVADDTWIFRAE